LDAALNALLGKGFPERDDGSVIGRMAAKPGFGSSAALPEIRTTAPLEAFKASLARIVRRRAP